MPTPWNIKYPQKYKKFRIVVHRLKILANCNTSVTRTIKCEDLPGSGDGGRRIWPSTQANKEQSYGAFNIFPFLLPHLLLPYSTQNSRAQKKKKKNPQIIKCMLLSFTPRVFTFQFSCALTSLKKMWNKSQQKKVKNFSSLLSYC